MLVGDRMLTCSAALRLMGLMVSSRMTSLPLAVTRAVRDLFLCAYLRMVVVVDVIPKDLGSWSEGCPCHEESLTDSASAHRRASEMRQ